MYFTKREYIADSLFLLLEPSGLNWGVRIEVSCLNFMCCWGPGVNKWTTIGSSIDSWNFKELNLLSKLLVRNLHLKLEYIYKFLNISSGLIFNRYSPTSHFRRLIWYNLIGNPIWILYRLELALLITEKNRNYEALRCTVCNLQVLNICSFL